MKFPWRVIGHRKVIDQLEKDIETGSVAHAYLFSGPQEIGKFSLARTFAMLLHCEQRNLCRNCESCSQIERNIHPDTLTVNRLWIKDKSENLEELAKYSNFDQSHRKKSGKKSDQIGIDDVLSVTEQIWQTTSARFKICLFKNIERMTEEAMNAFLKILEEPPEKTVFLLTATHPETLLPTLVSRTRRVEMHLIPDAILAAELSERSPDTSDFMKEKILSLSQGRSARMIRFLEDPDFLKNQEELFGTIAKLLKEKNLRAAFDLAEELAKGENEEGMNTFLDALTDFLRTLLREKVFERSLSLGASLENEYILKLLEKTEEIKFKISRNVNKRLALENLFLSF